MIGDDIKKYLNNNGIKQSIISEKTGISEPKLSMMLNDKRRKADETEYSKATSPQTDGTVSGEIERYLSCKR